jgi:hypothetical protein
LGTHEEFEDEIKKLEVARMVVSLLFDVAMGNYQLA